MAAQKPRDQVFFYLNGEPKQVFAEQSGQMFADFLRYEMQLTGTKIVCAEGDCGACTVLRWFPHEPGKPRLVAINSCIATVAQMDGSSLVTVDALKANGKLTDVQESLVKSHGSQCGFCTPGFVMALSGLVEKRLVTKNQKPISSQEAKNCLTGNLCRCTGYQPIVDAATALDLKKTQTLNDRFLTRVQVKKLREVVKSPLKLEGEGFRFYAPTSLAQAKSFLAKNKGTRIVGAATDLGVVSNKGKLELDEVLSLHLIEALYDVEKKKKNRIFVGARVTLSRLRRELKTSIPEFSEFLDLFASPQIKNVATLVGNVVNASPVADTPPFLLVSEAVVHLVGSKGKRDVPLEKFYLAYRKTAIKVGEFVYGISFRIPEKKNALRIFKTSQRKDLDISAVGAAFYVEWDDREALKIKKVSFAMAGVAATPLRLKKTEKLFKGKVLGSDLVREATKVLHGEMTPMSDLRGTAAFRRVLVENLFHRFWRELL